MEQRFQTLYGIVRSILSGSGMDKVTRSNIWPEAANNAMTLDGVLITYDSSMNAFAKLFAGGEQDVSGI